MNMRVVIVLLMLIVAQVGIEASANRPPPPSSTGRPLTLIPTAVQELKELRMNTGTKTLYRDGTRNDLYLKRTPAPGSVYLNFHVDIAVADGPFLLHASDICLEGAGTGAPSVELPRAKTAPDTSPAVTYTPWDMFSDDGGAEVHCDSLTVTDKVLLQFTIEVPQAGRDDLILFVRSQRIGTVREIREGIARNRGSE
jgi:hypothetical protein